MPTSYVAVSTDGSVRIVINKEPCAPSILERIDPKYHALFSNATVIIKSKAMAACWAVGPDGMVNIIADNGETGVLPPEVFKPSEGA